MTSPGFQRSRRSEARSVAHPRSGAGRCHTLMDPLRTSGHPPGVSRRRRSRPWNSPSGYTTKASSHPHISHTSRSPPHRLCSVWSAGHSIHGISTPSMPGYRCPSPWPMRSYAAGSTSRMLKARPSRIQPGSYGIEMIGSFAMMLLRPP